MIEQKIKELIIENILFQDNNIKLWMKQIEYDAKQGKNVFHKAHNLELAREYRQAYVDLLIQIERAEAKE